MFLTYSPFSELMN